MTSCQKCGQVQLSGPRYCDGRHGDCGMGLGYAHGEHLYYRCGCGYVVSEPCADAPGAEITAFDVPGIQTTAGGRRVR